MNAWVYDPHSGGVKIPPAVQQRTEQRIRSYAEAHYAGKFTRLGIRFRGAFCYIDAYTEPVEPSASLLLAVDETREQSTLSGAGTYPYTCAGYGFSEMKNDGAWPSTLTATRNMNAVRHNS